MTDWDQSFLADIPGWITAFAAIVALVFGIWQVLAAKRSQHEATAKEIWKDYHLHGIQYSKFANPELSNLDCEKEELDGDRGKFFDYQWFVSFMLLACDEILQLRGGSNWEKIVENNIDYHRDYIKSSAFNKESYEVLSPKLKIKIKQIKKKRNRKKKKNSEVLTSRA